MAVRVIQHFVRTCAQCPNSRYYSGGAYECILTDERMNAERRSEEVGAKCPLPFAGPPIENAGQQAAVIDRCDLRRRISDLLTAFNAPDGQDLVLDDVLVDFIENLGRSGE